MSTLRAEATFSRFELAPEAVATFRTARRSHLENVASARRVTYFTSERR